MTMAAVSSSHQQNQGQNHGAGPNGHGRVRPGKKPKVIIVLPPSMRNINLQRLEFVAQDCLDDDAVTVKDLNVQFAWLADVDIAELEGGPGPTPIQEYQSVAAAAAPAAAPAQQSFYQPAPAAAVTATRALTPLPPATPPTTARPTTSGTSGTYRVFVSNLHPDLPNTSLRALVPAGLPLVDLATNPIRPIGPQKELVLSANFVFASDADATHFMTSVKHASNAGDFEQYVVPGLRVQVSNPMPVVVTAAAPPQASSDMDAAPQRRALPPQQPPAAAAPMRNPVPVLSGYEPVGSWADDGSANAANPNANANTNDYFARNNSGGGASAAVNGRASGPTQDTWGGAGANGRQDSWGAPAAAAAEPAPAHNVNGFDDNNDWNSGGAGARNGPTSRGLPAGGARGLFATARGGDARADMGESSGSSMRGYARNERESSGYGGGSGGAYGGNGGSGRGIDRFGGGDAHGDARAGGDVRGDARGDARAGGGGDRFNSSSSAAATPVSSGGWDSNAGGWDSANDRTDRNAGSGGWDDKPAPAAAAAAAAPGGPSAWEVGASSSWDTGAAGGGGGDWATAADPWDVSASAAQSAAPAADKQQQQQQGGGWNDEQHAPIEKQGGERAWNEEPIHQGGAGGWNNVEPVQKQGGGWNNVEPVASNDKQDDSSWAAAEPEAQQQVDQEQEQEQQPSAADFEYTAAPEEVDFDDQGMSFEAQTAGLDEQAPASFEDQTADLDAAPPAPVADTEAEPARSASPAKSTKSNKSKSRSRSRSRSPARSPSPPRVKADPLTVTIDGMNPKAPSSQVLSLLGSHVPVDVIPTPMKRFGGADGPQMRGAKFVFASEDEANAFIAHVREMIEEGRTKGVEAPEIGLLIDWE